MVVVTMQNGRKPCTAITWGSSESLGNTQIQACFKTCPQHCKTSTPGSNPGGASNFCSMILNVLADTLARRGQRLVERVVVRSLFSSLTIVIRTDPSAGPPRLDVRDELCHGLNIDRQTVDQILGSIAWRVRRNLADRLRLPWITLLVGATQQVRIQRIEVGCGQDSTASLKECLVPQLHG
jgi:hypothetical protein